MFGSVFFSLLYSRCIRLGEFLVGYIYVVGEMVLFFLSMCGDLYEGLVYIIE